MASRPFLAAGLLCVAVSALAAQAAAGPAVAGPARSFFFRLDENGKPVFTQILRWEADPNAYEYQVIVKDSSGSEVFDERVSSSQVEVHLAPGSYQFRIITYNLLDKAEAESAWNNLTIVKAEQPAISSVFPKTISLDSMDGRLTVVGTKLLDKGTIALISQTGEKYPGLIKTRKGDQELVVVFPDKAYRPGTYNLYAENPGGLSTTFGEAIRVRLQSPLDFLASVGYSPLVALYDQWFAQAWASNFHPLSFDARLGLLFIKKRWGSLGLELGAQERRMVGDFGAATLTSDFTLAGAGFLYAYRFTRQLHGLLRLGGGVSMSYHSFDYQNYAGPTTTSYDPFARAGIALQAYVSWKLYCEIGADCSCIFLLDHNAIGITPTIGLGYQLF
ncbi:MAG TPA: hypothetical protein VMV83_11470 [Rectinemataceae bacterium]|nr:hypothetical protein [Rectinemataceae bacterium]